MTISENEFLWPIRVYYEDTDSGGVVYYANYLKFMERARTELLRSLGFEQDQCITEHGVVFVVHSLSIKYNKPAVFNDELVVKTKINHCAKASFDFLHSIVRVSDEVEVCLAEVKVACVNSKDFSATMMPEIIRTKIKKEVVSGS